MITELQQNEEFQLVSGKYTIGAIIKEIESAI